MKRIGTWHGDADGAEAERRVFVGLDVLMLVLAQQRLEHRHQLAVLQAVEGADPVRALISFLSLATCTRRLRDGLVALVRDELS